jgi:hypothetical protein
MVTCTVEQHTLDYCTPEFKILFLNLRCMYLEPVKLLYGQSAELPCNLFSEL